MEKFCVLNIYFHHDYNEENEKKTLWANACIKNESPNE